MMALRRFFIGPWFIGVSRRPAAAVLIALALAGPAAAQTPAPDPAQAEAMIKTTLIALNHANLTGNYTVLRDLGSPRFRAANTAARLAAVFAPMREEALDMTPLVLLTPQLEARIGMDDRGQLRLIGYMPSRPLRLVFDLAYESAGNRWWISDLAVNAVPAPEADGEPPSQDSEAEQPPEPRPQQQDQ